MKSVRWCVALLLCVSFAAGEIKNVGWWKNMVFYQVYPRSFMDANDDGIGDLKGITKKLEHFKDMGIGAIWLSPIYASPMVDFGYDISDFRKIHEDYGSMEDFEELTNKAKELGIKVIMDLVPNHTSDKHDWFVQSSQGIDKYKDYYVWREGTDGNREPPNNWISVFSGSAWTYDNLRGSWYFHQFEYRQPDLNYTNPDVRHEMEDIIKFWLGKGVDGFRVDAIPHVYERDHFKDEPKSNIEGATVQSYTYLDHIYTKDDPRTYDLIKSWRNLLDEWSDKKNEDEKVIMTEAYTNLPNTTKYYYYGSHIPFNFNFIMNITKDSKPSEYKKVIDDWLTHTPKDGSANWVMGNHDRSRVASRFPGRADQMTMLAMILPGIAVTYNGEEIAMEDKDDITWEDTKDPQACNTDPEHYKTHSRDPNRTPFQWDDTTNAGFSKSDKLWLPVNENYKTLNLMLQKSESESHYNLYRNLISLRSSNTLKNGGIEVSVIKDEVLAVVRKTDEESIVLLINFADEKLQEVDLTPHTGDAIGTIYVSSVGSKIAWDSSVQISKVQLPAKASVVVKATTVKKDPSGGGGSGDGAYAITPMRIILLLPLISLFKLM